MDAFGTGALFALFLVLAVNQVVIKLTNEGLQPVLAAGLRSLGAIPVVWLWMRARGQRLDFQTGTVGAGVLVGLIFTVEFLGLFIALDRTTVTRVSVIFYSMPLWMALTAHFLLPGEHLSRIRAVGLGAAFAGVAWAIVDRTGLGGEASLMGDLAALVAAWGWMGVSLAARLTPLVRLRPEMQMFWQLAVSAPVLLFAALFFGPFIRDLRPVHGWMMAYQVVVIAAGAFLAWFWLLTRYKASAVASFAFLSPVFGVALGWLWLGETVTPTFLAQLALVAVGIVLINRPERAGAEAKPSADADEPIAKRNT